MKIVKRKEKERKKTLELDFFERNSNDEFNQMKRNHSKYQAITFGRVKRNPVLTGEGTVIPSQDEMELLGVPIDNKLKFVRKIHEISLSLSLSLSLK